MHQQRVSQMIKSAEGCAGLLHKITKPTAWRGGCEDLEEEEDVRLMDRCEAEARMGVEGVEIVQGKDRSRTRWLPSRVLLNFAKETRGEVMEFWEKV